MVGIHVDEKVDAEVETENLNVCSQVDVWRSITEYTWEFDGPFPLLVTTMSKA